MGIKTPSTYRDEVRKSSICIADNIHIRVTVNSKSRGGRVSERGTGRAQGWCHARVCSVVRLVRHHHVRPPRLAMIARVQIDIRDSCRGRSRHQPRTHPMLDRALCHPRVGAGAAGEHVARQSMDSRRGSDPPVRGGSLPLRWGASLRPATWHGTPRLPARRCDEAARNPLVERHLPPRPQDAGP